MKERKGRRRPTSATLADQGAGAFVRTSDVRGRVGVHVPSRCVVYNPRARSPIQPVELVARARNGLKRSHMQKAGGGPCAEARPRAAPPPFLRDVPPIMLFNDDHRDHSAMQGESSAAPCLQLIPHVCFGQRSENAAFTICADSP